jgi:competence protein ComEA
MLCRVRFAAVILSICTGYALAQESRPDASTSREDAADKAAFQAVCGSCHPLTMVDGLRTESEWLQEIEQMVKIGAKGTDEQFERVVRVLLRTLTKVNVNTATAPEIAPVLDVTDATAEALVRYRTEHGSFKALDDLKKIPGVDAAKLNARKERIVF